MKEQSRIKQTGEVFTELDLVDHIINEINLTDTCLDPSCGNGQFLIQIFRKTNHLGWPTIENINNYRERTIKKIVKSGIFNEEKIVEKKSPVIGGIFGIDICIDNVCDTIARLVLFEKTKEDFWERNSKPKKELCHPEHNNEEFLIYHLKRWENKKEIKYERHYNNIIVRHKGWMNDGKAAYFEYKYKDEDWLSCFNIVCADALDYDYEFRPDE